MKRANTTQMAHGENDRIFTCHCDNSMPSGACSDWTQEEWYRLMILLGYA